MAAGLRRALAAGAMAAAISFASDPSPTGQTPVGTGVITGRVIDATSRQPVRDATVEVTSVPENPTTIPIKDCCNVVYGGATWGRFKRIATTDADGRFAFRNLPANTFEVHATRVGRIAARWGQQSPVDGGRWIELRDDERVDGLEIALPRMPIVGGRVLDEHAEPVGGLGILVTPALEAGSMTPARTDDRGMYRAEVMPGEYVVSTVAYPGIRAAGAAMFGEPVSAWPGSTFPHVFFPQANTRDGAARVVVGPGDQRTELDFVVRPERVFTVSARVSGSPVGPGPVRSDLFRMELFAANERAPGSAPLATGSGGLQLSGFNGVSPGRYVLHAFIQPYMPRLMHGIAPLGQLPEAPTLWAEQEIAVVDRDVEVRLSLQPGARITGRVEFDGAGEPPLLGVLNGQPLVVERADGADSDIRGTFQPGGRFSTIQMEPGRYIVRPVPPPDWRLKSVMSGGRDISDYPIEVARSDVTDAVITFTDRRSAISGRIVREGPDDTTRGWITVFPADRAYWFESGVYPRRIVFIECGLSGRFEAEVPPGSYYVVATRWATRGRLSVERLSALASSATPVVVGDNQTVQQDVRFSRGR